MLRSTVAQICRVGMPRAPMTLRMMSSTPETPKKYHYFVYAPDSKDGNRFAVREQHFGALRPEVDSGLVRIGGMTLKPGSEHGAEKLEDAAHGSIFITEAESLEQVKAFIEKDIYYTSGVWDKDNIIISPLKVGFNEPLSKLG